MDIKPMSMVHVRVSLAHLELSPAKQQPVQSTHPRKREQGPGDITYKML